MLALWVAVGLIDGASPVSQPPTPVIIGGGGASAKRRGRLRGEGWGRERAILEASLAAIEAQDVQAIARTMAESERPQAQRIARKLIDYTGEAAQIESLTRELAKLEAAQRERTTQAERDEDLRAAAAELRAVLRDDQDVMEALEALEAIEVRQIINALGFSVH